MTRLITGPHGGTDDIPANPGKLYTTERPYNPEIDRGGWFGYIVTLDFSDPQHPTGSRNLVTNRALFHRLIDGLIKKGYQRL